MGGYARPCVLFLIIGGVKKYFNFSEDKTFNRPESFHLDEAQTLDSLTKSVDRKYFKLQIYPRSN